MKPLRTGFPLSTDGTPNRSHMAVALRVLAEWGTTGFKSVPDATQALAGYSGPMREPAEADVP